MALPGYSRMDDPLKKVMPQTGIVQNTGSMVPNTAPIANRPVAAPAVKLGTPGPAIGVPQFKAGAPAPGTIPAPPQLAPAPMTPPAPAAPAAAPVAPAAPAAAPELYGRAGGGTPSLEDQIRSYISGAMGGVTSKAFIDRAKSQLGSNVEGQRAQAVRRSNEDLISRGLGKSGLGTERADAIGVGAQSALTSGIQDILSKAEQQDIAGRESAAGTAGNLLGMNRSWDQYTQQRADEQAARAGGGGAQDTSFTYVDPDTGESYQMDESWF